MKLPILGALAACVMAMPANAATTVGIGPATRLTYSFIFSEPVTATINIALDGYRYFEQPAGTIITADQLDSYDALEFNGVRQRLGRYTGFVDAGPGYRYYTAFDTLTYRVEGTNLTPLVRISASFGVPEPATWALMILGFGAIGGAIRFRTPLKSGSTS